MTCLWLRRTWLDEQTVLPPHVTGSWALAPQQHVMYLNHDRRVQIICTALKRPNICSLTRLTVSMQTAGMHQALSYQELFLGSQVGGFILDQRALDAGFMHQDQHTVPSGGLGGGSGEQGAPASFDPHALVLSALTG